MNTSPPKIFDPKALTFAKARAAQRQARRGASFLYERLAEDAASRLEDINRQFQRAVLIGAVDGRQMILENLRPARQPETFEYVKDATDLSGEYDLILSLLELQSDDALPDTLGRFRAALAPDGLMLAASLGGDTLSELRQVLYATDQALLGGATARVFPMIDYSQAAMLLGRVGFALPVVDSDRLQVHYAQLLSLIHDLRDLGLSNSLAARDRRAVPKQFLSHLENVYGAHFAREDGKLRATFETLWMTGWAPHASQQKPLKPGSAKMRLADALGAKEKKI